MRDFSSAFFNFVGDASEGRYLLEKRLSLEVGEEENDMYFGWGVGKEWAFYSFLTQPPVPDQVVITASC